ncbi:MAG: hypothetical protein JNM94_13565 [Phycisphaerae bacterium]|nr:hypothetical protein [Phycisphaerae bacterium]
MRCNGSGLSRWHPHVIIVAALSHSAHAQCAYEIVAILDLPPCGIFQPVLYPMSINNNGEVVGSFGLCEIGEDRPFYWSEETGLVLPSLPSGYLGAAFVDINDQGQITGHRVVAGSSIGHEAILYEDGQWTGLGTLPGGNWSDGVAINNSGVIVGFWDIPLTAPVQAFVWTDGTMSGLGTLLGGGQSAARGISESGVIVGSIGPSLPGLQSGFILEGEKVTIVEAFPGTTTARVIAMNQAGLAIVNCATAGEWTGYQGFVVDGDSWQYVSPIPPGAGVATTAINACGTVLGINYSTDFSQVVTFSQGEVRVVEDMILAEQRYQLYFASAINDAGWIAAAAQIGQTFMTLVLRPAPQKLGDLNEDCEVDATDLALLIERWGQADDRADLDGDGIVAGADLGMLLGKWGT